MTVWHIFGEVWLIRYESYLPDFETLDFELNHCLDQLNIFGLPDCWASELWSFPFVREFETPKITKFDYLIGCILNQYS